jgi:MFS family permease
LAGRGRLLVLVSIAMVIETATYSAITPLLPHIVAVHGLSKATAGVLTGAYPIGSLVFALPAGWLSARIGAKPTVIGALAVLGASGVAFGLGTSTGVLIAARLGQGIAAAAVWSGALAWVVGVVDPGRRGEAIGTTIGAAIGGALGGPVLGTLAAKFGAAPVFSGFFAVPLAVMAILVRQPGPVPVPGPGLAAVRASLVEPLMRQGMWLMVLPAAAFGLFNVLVPLRLHAFGAGAVAIGAVFLLTVVGESVVAPIAGRMADRHGPVRPARVGLALGGLALALVPLPGAAVLLAITVLIAVPLMGILWTPAMALLNLGAEARGIDPAFGFALGNLAWGIGASLGGSGGGALAQATADAVPYLVVAAAAVVTSAALRRPRAAVPGSAPHRSAPSAVRGR